jgi:hypothetical protein
LPRFELRLVRKAAEEDRVELGGKRFVERLSPYVHTFQEMREFTRAVLSELEPEDFMKSVQYGEAVFDSYGVAISERTQEQFSVEGLETWFVKFTLEESFEGELVVMASLHAPEAPLDRVGGTLPVRFTRREG